MSRWLAGGRAASALLLLGSLAASDVLAQGYVVDPARVGAPVAPPAVTPNATLALTPNGSFESNGGVNTSVFANWTVVDQAGGSGSWRVQTGTASPINGFVVPAPPLGTFAAMTDQGGPGSHVLYQNVTIPPEGAIVSFSLYLNNQGGAYSIPAGGSLDYNVNPNQQFRADLMDPAAADFDVGAGVVLNLYQTRVGDPLVSGYTRIVRTVPGNGTTRTLRLRFAEVDNQGFFNAGIDNVDIEPLSRSIPTLDARGVALLALALGMVAFFALRRRRKA